MRRRLYISLLGSFLLMVATLADAAQTRPEEQAREMLVTAARLQAEIGTYLGDEEVVEAAQQSASLWQRATASSLRQLFGLTEGRDAGLVQLRWLVQRHRTTRDGLAAMQVGSAGAAEDADWPEAACPIPSVQEDPSWPTYVDLVLATEAALETYQVIASGCEKVEITPITVLPENAFVFTEPETCHIRVEGFIVLDIGDCQLRMGGEGFGTGGRATGGELLPLVGASNAVACTAAATGIVAAQKSQELLAQALECWDAGTAEANYKRLGVIHDEVQAIQQMADAVRRLLFEHTMVVRGGSRPAIAYLPTTLGGFLEETRRTVEVGNQETAELGYRMRPGIQRYMEDGDRYRDLGDIKRAFDRYRKAFKLVSRNSLKFPADEDPTETRGGAK